MKRDELIDIWKAGSREMFRSKKTDKEMITKYLNEKTLKGTRGIYFNIVFFWFIQIANLILLSLNLAGYQNNPVMIWILIPQIVLTIGIMIFGMDLFYRLREINNYSETLQNLLNKQLRFFRKPYELWLAASSVSAVILMINVNLNIDNDHGTYHIYHRMVFAAVTLGVLLFMYVVQKVASRASLRSVKAYLLDLKQGVLEQSELLEQKKRKLVWFYVIVFILLTASMILGLITALT